MDDTIDLLQIKIEKAKAALPDATLNAIATVDWKAAILGLRETKGYSFEQLGDLETETELVLCGLLDPEKYPRELETRMKISEAQVNELVDTMNKEVFMKIREELIKSIERKKIFEKKEEFLTPDSIQPEKISPPVKLDELELSAPKITLVQPETPKLEKKDTDILDKSGIRIINKEEPMQPAQNLIARKLSGSFQMPSVKTERTIEDIAKPAPPITTSPNAAGRAIQRDPYREVPE